MNERNAVPINSLIGRGGFFYMMNWTNDEYCIYGPGIQDILSALYFNHDK